MSEFRKFKLRQYINSKINNLSKKENEFVEIELSFPFTNLFRLDQLIWFLERCRQLQKDFDPILIFVRNKEENIDQIYMNSKSLNDLNFPDINNEDDYWERISFEGI